MSYGRAKPPHNVRFKLGRVRTERYALNRHKFLSEAEVEHLEGVLKRTLATEDERDALCLLLALRTGARAQEILNFKRADYSNENGTFFIKGIKGSNDREIPLPDWLQRSVERYLRKTSGDVLFDFGYHRLRQIWLFYRPVPKKFHSLRHTFAIMTYIKNRDVRLLQVALGHRSIINTLIYVDYVYSLSELKRIVW